MHNATYSSGNYGSQVYVYYDCFQYGKSNGIGFDPQIIVPCTLVPNDDDIPPPNDDDKSISFGYLFLGCFVISLIVLTVTVKKHKKIVIF